MALLDVPLREGREFVVADSMLPDEPVMVTSDFARRLFGSAPAVGKRLTLHVRGATSAEPRRSRRSVIDPPKLALASRTARPWRVPGEGVQRRAASSLGNIWCGRRHRQRVRFPWCVASCRRRCHAWRRRPRRWRSGTPPHQRARSGRPHLRRRAGRSCCCSARWASMPSWRCRWDTIAGKSECGWRWEHDRGRSCAAPCSGAFASACAGRRTACRSLSWRWY